VNAGRATTAEPDSIEARNKGVSFSLLLLLLTGFA
jgi:hypothetical protein